MVAFSNGDEIIEAEKQNLSRVDRRIPRERLSIQDVKGGAAIITESRLPGLVIILDS